MALTNPEREDISLARRSTAPIPDEARVSMTSSEHRIITIGASAGGIEALRAVLHHLPADLPAAIFVVMHISADSPGLLPEILSRNGALPAAHPVDREVPRPGRIYVAPPDHHLLLDPSGRIRLSRGPKENRFRPAIDPLFRSAAHAHGPRVIGVVLTGALDDGTAGLWAIERHGGVTVVQDPDDAFASSMPLSALRYVNVDYCLPAAQLGPLLTRLAMEPMTASPSRPETTDMDLESRLLLGEAPSEPREPGRSSFYTCPECHGTLEEIAEGRLVRYRCHVGHAYSLDTLMSELTRTISEALWNALRAIEESAKLLRQEAEQARLDQDFGLAERYLQKTMTAQMNADAVRAVAMRQERLNRARVKEAGTT
jgi:two-component system chemotaxis response regulator CheB